MHGMAAVPPLEGDPPLSRGPQAMAARMQEARWVTDPFEPLSNHRVICSFHAWVTSPNWPKAALASIRHCCVLVSELNVLACQCEAFRPC